MANRIRKLEVHLTQPLRDELESIARSQKESAAKVRRARILLLADEDHIEGRRPDWQIAERVGLTEKQVKRVRQQFVREGMNQTLKRKQRSDAGIPKKMHGAVEAKLITLCCSDPPSGRQRWTLKLLADELCRLRVVTEVCPETVRKCLKKIASNHGKPSDSVFLNATTPVL